MTGIFHSRIFLTLVLAFLIISQGGAAHEIKGGYVPGAISAAYGHSEPINAYSSHGAYEKECLNCHAPVSCLAANQCPDCHQEFERECAEAEGLNSMLPGADNVQISRIEHQERADPVCDAPFGAINHEHLSGFSLSRHRAGFDGTPLTCESCHPDGLYAAASVTCTGCHAKEAPAYMADHTIEYEGDCADCHDGWGRLASFEQGEVHALDGAHKDAGCQDCHTGSTFAEGVRDCSDCHEEPEVHAGETGLHCDWCHTVVAWLPAQLTEHSFRLDHGGLDEASCEACHTGTYETYTCYGCHEHQSAEIQERHGQEGIDQLEPCGRCHPTGANGEAARLGHGLGGQNGGLEAPGLNPGGQLPAGGAKIAPPGQEVAEQMGPADGMAGPAEPAGVLTEPAGVLTEPAGVLTEPAGVLTEPGGSPEEPVDSTMGPSPSLPGEQDPAPTRPDGSDNALSPIPSRGG